MFVCKVDSTNVLQPWRHVCKLHSVHSFSYVKLAYCSVLKVGGLNFVICYWLVDWFIQGKTFNEVSKPGMTLCSVDLCRTMYREAYLILTLKSTSAKCWRNVCHSNIVLILPTPGTVSVMFTLTCWKRMSYNLRTSGTLITSDPIV